MTSNPVEIGNQIPHHHIEGESFQFAHSLPDHTTSSIMASAHHLPAPCRMRLLKEIDMLKNDQPAGISCYLKNDHVLTEWVAS